MSWIGRFLELSLQSEDLIADLRDFEQHGFRQLETGDIWSHRYAVISDGSLHIGLHSDLPSPTMLTFVHPNVYELIDEFLARGIEPDEVKLGPDQFNLIRFHDSNETAIQVIEARTFSPPAFDDVDISQLGQFLKLQLPIRDIKEEQEADKLFWQRLGLRATKDDQNTLTMSGRDYSIEFNPRLRAGEVRAMFENDGEKRVVDVRKLF